MKSTDDIKDFTALYQALDFTNSDERRYLLFHEYLERVSDTESAWIIHLLRGGKQKRLMDSKSLVRLAQQNIDLSPAIFQSVIDFCTDNLEAVSLAIPNPASDTSISLGEIMQLINKLRNASIEVKHEAIIKTWTQLSGDSRLLFNRLLTNTFRSPLDEFDVIRYLSKIAQVPVAHVSLFFYHYDQTLPITLLDIREALDLSAHAIFPAGNKQPLLIETLDELDELDQYIASVELNGVRAQLITTHDEIHIWHPDGKLWTDKLPELRRLANHLPKDIILDGLLIARDDSGLLPKKYVHKRLTKKTISKKMEEEQPILFCVIDILKQSDENYHSLTYNDRRQKLIELFHRIGDLHQLQMLDDFTIENKNEVQAHFSDLKLLHSHALILKNKNGRYNEAEGWYKLKSPAKIVRGVLLYIKRGDGVLANQFIEYTLGAKSGSTYVPFARVSAQFSDDLLLEIKQWIKENTQERFGPVLSLHAQLIFEIKYDAVQASGRHKSGIQLIKPTFVQWVKDGTIEDIVSLAELVQDIPK